MLEIKFTGIFKDAEELFQDFIIRNAETYLRKLGFSVFNPANFPFGLEYESYLKICKSIIEEVDYIYVLKDFKDSEGAKIEIKHTERIRKRIIYQDAEDREFIESIVRI